MDLQIDDSAADKLRKAFLTQYADKSPQSYHRADMASMRDETEGLARAKLYLEHEKGDQEKALKLMNVSFTWRSDLKVPELREEDMPRDYLEKGGVYFRNKTLSGRDIMYFNLKLHQKDPGLNIVNQKRIAMLLERHRKANDDKIVVLFDLAGVGLANVEIDLLKYVITCFTTYFPAMLEMLLVYEMPWIVSGVWKIVKLILTEEQRKAVIFCKKSSIGEYVSKENLSVQMGGTDDYKFRYIPYVEPSDSLGETVSQGSASGEEEASTPQPSASPTPVLNGSHGDGAASLTTSGQSSDGYASLTTSVQSSNGVISSGEMPSSSHSGPSSSATNNGSIGSSRVSAVRGKAGGDLSAKPLSPQAAAKGVAFSERPSVRLFQSINEPKEQDGKRKVTSSHSSKKGKDTGTKLFGIEPSSQLTFVRADINSNAQATICLTNQGSDAPRAFKIKTTDPDHYKVRTSYGLLQPQESCEVSVTLLRGREIERDKFLVLHTVLGQGADLSPSAMAAFWRSVAPNTVQEHRLRCVEEQEETTTRESRAQVHRGADTEVSRLRELDQKVESLRRDVQSVARLQMAVLVIVCLCLVFLFTSAVLPSSQTCSGGF